MARIAPARELHGRLLITGDGNLSYAMAIARTASRCGSIVATTYEDQTTYAERYGLSTPEQLATISGVRVLHGVDATQLRATLSADLRDAKFSKAVWNFPHHESKGRIDLNRWLLREFCAGVKDILEPRGELQVRLCRGQGGSPADFPRRYGDHWQMLEAASEAGFVLTRLDEFLPSQFPGYASSGYRKTNTQFFQRGSLSYTFHKAPPSPLLQSAVCWLCTEAQHTGGERETDSWPEFVPSAVGAAAALLTAEMQRRVPLVQTCELIDASLCLPQPFRSPIGCRLRIRSPGLDDGGAALQAQATAAIAAVVAQHACTPAAEACIRTLKWSRRDTSDPSVAAPLCATPPESGDVAAEETLQVAWPHLQLHTPLVPFDESDMEFEDTESGDAVMGDTKAARRTVRRRLQMLEEQRRAVETSEAADEPAQFWYGKPRDLWPSNQTYAKWFAESKSTATAPLAFQYGNMTSTRSGYIDVDVCLLAMLLHDLHDARALWSAESTYRDGFHEYEAADRELESLPCGPYAANIAQRQAQLRRPTSRYCKPQEVGEPIMESDGSQSAAGQRCAAFGTASLFPPSYQHQIGLWLPSSIQAWGLTPSMGMKCFLEGCLAAADWETRPDCPDKQLTEREFIRTLYRIAGFGVREVAPHDVYYCPKRQAVSVGYRVVYESLDDALGPQRAAEMQLELRRVLQAEWGVELR